MIVNVALYSYIACALRLMTEGMLASLVWPQDWKSKKEVSATLLQGHQNKSGVETPQTPHAQHVITDSQFVVLCLLTTMHRQASRPQSSGLLLDLLLRLQYPRNSRVDKWCLCRFHHFYR